MKPTSIRRGVNHLFYVFEALLLQEVWRHGRSKWTLFAFALLICEPVGVIIAFGTILYLMLRMPPYGTSTLLFHATGIIPFYYFIRVSQRTRSFEIEKSNRLPCIDPFDEFLVLCLLDFVVMSVSTVIIFSGLAQFVTPLAIPFNPMACIGSLIVVSLLAFGLNLICAAMFNISRVFVTLLIISMRGLMLFSGVVFVVDFMPANIRYWLNLNPLSHAIMWFRSGIYPRYPAYSLDLYYLFIFTAASVLVGLLTEQAMRGRGTLNDTL